MTYGDQQHVSWKLVRSFPFPEIEELEKHEDQIEELAEELWAGIENRFHPDINVSGEIQGVAELKPLVDQVDGLFSPIFGLNEQEVEYANNLDTKYGRSLREEGQQGLPDSNEERAPVEDD